MRNMKKIKIFNFDVTKTKEAEIEKQVNKFLSTVKDSDLELTSWLEEKYFIVTILYKVRKK